MVEPPKSRVGKYEIESQLGTGGMGTVYRARLAGPGKVTKEVALKLLHPHLCADEGFVAQFHREMRLAMLMTHRNIVQTFDAGVEGERHFLVMELVEGCSLRDLLRMLPHGARLPVRLALFIVRETADALAHAHNLDLELTGLHGGVIHQDVCPNNILLSRQGDVKLTDFGVAQASTTRADPAAAVQGKLRYMAPEQARGESEPRSDIFALGAVLHELLAAEPMRASPATVDEVRSGEDLSRRRPLDGVPDEVAALVARCTDAEREPRPLASALVRELDGLLHRLADDAEAVFDPRAALGEFVSARFANAADEGQRGRANRVAELLLKTGGILEPTTATARAPAPSRSASRALLLAAATVLLVLAGVASWLALRPEDGPAPVAPNAGSRATTADAVPDAAVDAAPDTGAPEATPGADGATCDVRRPRRRDGRRPRRKKRHGLLDVNAVPWAFVYVDGRKLGVTPRQGIRLRPGRHRVRLVNPALKASRTLSVDIRPGQRVRKVVVFRAP